MNDENRSIGIGGGVTGGNVNIGGTNNYYVSAKAERLCPSPEAEPDKFGGRDVPLKKIMTRIKSGQDTAITAVHGVGGIGKTTLARVLAARLYADKTFCAVLWANITPTPNAVNILHTWVISYADSAFDVSIYKGDEGQIALAAKDQLESVIAEKCACGDSARVLVVLDDVWESGREAVRLIRKACPKNTTVLITTRSQNVAVDIGAAVEPLAYLTPDEAVEMLKEYLQGFDDAPLKRLAVALGGHALALELAARRVQKEKRPGENDASKLARLVGEYEAGIPAGSPFAKLKLEQGEQKEDNLTRSLSQSYEVLDEDSRRCFRALGVLAYDVPFRAEILAALWDIPLETVYTIADQLQQLALLELKGEAYTLHPLLRAYARALLDEAGEHDAAFLRYAAVAVQIVEKYIEQPKRSWEELEDYVDHWFYIGFHILNKFEKDSEIDNSLAIIAYNLTRYTVEYISFRKDPRRYLWAQFGYEIASMFGNIAQQTVFSTLLTSLYTEVGRLSEARKFAENTIGLANSVHYIDVKINAYRAITDYYVAHSDFESALSYLKTAQEIIEKHNVSDAIPHLKFDLGRYYFEKGEVFKAKTYLEEVMKFVGDQNNTVNVGILFNFLSMCYMELGEYDRALEHTLKALEYRNQIKDMVGRANSLNVLGMIYGYQGKIKEVLTPCQEALGIFERLGNLTGQGHALHNIGWAYAELGNLKLAVGYFNRSLKLRRLVGDKKEEVKTLNLLGHAYAKLGDFPKAQKCITNELKIRHKMNQFLEKAYAHIMLSRIYAGQKQFKSAIHQLKEALAIFSNINNDKIIAQIYDWLNGLYQLSEQPQKSTEYAKLRDDMLRKIANLNKEDNT